MFKPHNLLIANNTFIFSYSRLLIFVFSMMESLVAMGSNHMEHFNRMQDDLLNHYTIRLEEVRP